MIRPYDWAARIPTAYNNETALIKSRRVFKVTVPPASVPPAPQDGKFSFFVQPKLGAPDSPLHFQIGWIDYTTGLPADLGELSAYHGEPQNGQSLAIDPNGPWITQNEPRFALLHSPTGAVGVNPLNGATNVSVNGVRMTYNMDWKVTPGVGVFNNASILSVPAGTYVVTITFASTGPIADATPFEIYKKGRTTAVLPSPVPYITTSFVAATDDTLTNTYAITLDESEDIAVMLTANQTKMTVMMSPLTSPAVEWNASNGLTESLRPVGMSVLTTCVLADLNNGGEIACCVSPQKFYDKLTANDSDRWDSVQGITSLGVPMHSGNLKFGACAWWRPSTQEDIAFRDPTDANDYEYPIILVTGTASAAPPGTVVMVTVEFCYEIIQGTQLFDKKRQTGTTAIYESGINLANRVTNVSENPEHNSVVKDVLELGANLLFPGLGSMLGAIF